MDPDDLEHFDDLFEELHRRLNDPSQYSTDDAGDYRDYLEQDDDGGIDDYDNWPDVFSNDVY